MEDVMTEYMSPETEGLLFRCFISSKTDNRWNRNTVLVDDGSGTDLEAACRSKIKILTNLIGRPPADLEYGYYNSLMGVLRPYDVHVLERENY